MREPLAEDQSPFEVTSDSELSIWNRLKDTLTEWVYAPLAVVLADWRGRIGLSILLMYFLMGTVGVTILDPPAYREAEALLGVLEDPRYPLGTSQRGVSLFDQLVFATPEMLQMVFGGAFFATVVATIVGTSSGYKGGYYEQVMMTFTDMMMTIPGLPLVIVLTSVVAPTNPIVIGVLLSINNWAGLARTIRSQTLSIREESYVEAAKFMDISIHRILGFEILPNLMPYIAVNFMNAGRQVIFGAIALYFLGVLPYNNENWGTLLNSAFQQGAIWSPDVGYLFWVPLTVIILLSLGLILLSQALDRVFNPQIRARHTTGED